MSDSNGSMQTFRASWHRGRVMSDVVQRLRAVAGERYSEGANSGGTAGLLEDAATEIERLRTRLKELEGQEPVGEVIATSEQFLSPKMSLYHNKRDCLSKGDKLYAAPQPDPAVPEGYALVPAEPTTEMWSAAAGVIGEYGLFPRVICDVYEAMLYAAPPAGRSENVVEAVPDWLIEALRIIERSASESGDRLPQSIASTCLQGLRGDGEES